MMDYYLPGKPGDASNWDNRMSLCCFDSMLCFSSFDILPILDSVPVFMASGSEAYTADNNEEFYDQLTGTKVRLLIGGAGHFDLYWMPEHVTRIADEATKFFRKHSRNTANAG